jgi:hypothetical protein
MSDPHKPLVNWYTIEHSGTGHMARAMVPGGWLVRISEDVYVNNKGYGYPNTGYEWRTSITFVPDPTHEWERW